MFFKILSLTKDGKKVAFEEPGPYVMGPRDFYVPATKVPFDQMITAMDNGEFMALNWGDFSGDIELTYWGPLTVNCHIHKEQYADSGRCHQCVKEDFWLWLRTQPCGKSDHLVEKWNEHLESLKKVWARAEAELAER